MEIIAKIAMIIFVAMVVAMLIVQIVAKQRVANKNFAERKKALARMTDPWFTVCYQNCQQTNWKGISRKLRKVYEAEKELRGIKI